VEKESVIQPVALHGARRSCYRRLRIRPFFFFVIILVINAIITSATTGGTVGFIAAAQERTRGMPRGMPRSTTAPPARKHATQNGLGNAQDEGR
jgi:hypothetical protein